MKVLRTTQEGERKGKETRPDQTFFPLLWIIITICKRKEKKAGSDLFHPPLLPGTALSSPVPPPRPKRTVPITPLLPVLFLLLGISLVTVAVLCKYSCAKELFPWPGASSFSILASGLRAGTKVCHPPRIRPIGGTSTWRMIASA